jgi:hypothetical protein
MFSDSDSDEAPAQKKMPNFDALDSMDFNKINNKAASQTETATYNN